MEIEEVKSANWKLAKIREHQKKIAEYEKIRDELIKEYEARIKTAKQICELDCASHLHAIQTLTEHLREFALNNLDKGKKSIRLPEGTMSFKASSPEIYFEGGEKPSAKSEKLIDYLRHYHSKFVETTYKANWTEFKKTLQFDLEKGFVIDEDGAVIDGLKVLPTADKFKITFPEADEEAS